MMLNSCFPQPLSVITLVLGQSWPYLQSGMDGAQAWVYLETAQLGGDFPKDVLKHPLLLGVTGL